MTNEEKLGFREWTVHYEKEQEADRAKINDLASSVNTINQSVGALTADVRTLIENQKGMFSRINQPVQWGVLVSAAAFVAVLLSLVTLPMKEKLRDLDEQLHEEVTRNLEIHIMLVDQMQDLALVTKETSIENKTNIQWIMQMEERLNSRLHSRYGLND